MKVMLVWIPKSKVFDLLHELERKSGKWLSVYVRGTDWPAWLGELAMPEFVEYLEEIRTKAYRVKSETGAVVFWEARQGKYLLCPPFPIERNQVKPYLELNLLYQLLEKEFTLGVVLVRHGAYALGIFKGDELLTSKVGRRYVLARHRKGGMSAARFARIRKEQIKKFYEEVVKELENKFKAYENLIEWIVLGGDKIACKALTKRCSFLRRHVERILPRILWVRQPNRKSLEGILQEVWKFKVYTW